MTQPSGRVLQFPAHSRTYLRISPIICGLDALAVLVRLFAYLWTKFCNSLPHAAARALYFRRRTRDSQTHPGTPEGVQALESLTTVRFLLLVFGALPQVVKVAAMGGVHWTKVWSGLYFASFVILECTIILADKSSGQLVLEEEPFAGFEDQIDVHQDPLENGILPRRLSTPVRGQAARQNLEVKLNTFENWCASVAALLHTSLLLWVFFVLLHPVIKSTLTEGASAVGNALVLWSVATIFIPLCVCLIWIRFVNTTNRRRTPIYYAVWVIFLILMAFWIALLSANKKAMEDFLTAWFMVLSYFAVLLVIWIVGILLARNRFTRYNVLLVSREEERSEEETRWSISVCMVAWCTMVLAVCFYAFRYDSAGTSKPKWADNFG